MRDPFQVIFAGGILVLLSLTAVAGYLWHRHHDAARAAASELAGLRAEQAELRALAEELRPERREARAAEIKELESEIALHANDLSRPGASPPDRGLPVTPLEAFLELAAFRATMRAQAEAAGVEVAPPAQFGFSAHATEAPAEGIVAELRRQREGLERLLGLLWRARPLALLSVRRERPEGSPAGGPADDFFVLDTSRAVRQAGRLDSCAFRLEFTGTTAVLHALVARMITREPSMFLRVVSVSPPAEVERGGAAAARPANEAELLAGPVRFVVVVEVVRPAALGEDVLFSR